jgi:succinyl-diaminopimelate desuccinylase
MKLDPVKLSLEIISKESISGNEDKGAIELLKNYLNDLGFENQLLDFSGDGSYSVSNLYSYKKSSGKNLCFAGHTDVVPPGDESLWSVKPFVPEIKDGVLIGRGAADMKCAVVAWLAAVSEFVTENPAHKTTLSFLITGDEEADAVNGTIKVLQHITKQGHKIDHTVVGEPTNPETLGDMIKIGRRGSVSFELVVNGVQGHVAYPDIADNPNTKLVEVLAKLNSYKFDDGNEFFPPTNLEVVSIDVNNKTLNLIPASATAKFNIRFNDIYTSEKLEMVLNDLCASITKDYKLTRIGGVAESFLNKRSAFVEFAVNAVKQVTGKQPEISTTGGTSDARFIKDYSEVLEFGLINKTAHKIDENAKVEDIIKLKDIYKNIIEEYEAKLA